MPSYVKEPAEALVLKEDSEFPGSILWITLEIKAHACVNKRPRKSRGKTKAVQENLGLKLWYHQTIQGMQQDIPINLDIENISI